VIYNNYAFKVPEEKMIRVITDTDAKNEGDDQFAIVHTLLSPRFDNAGFIAAHYGIGRHRNSMERSFAELETIFSRMDLDPRGLLSRGGETPMPDKNTPVDSEGARLIIREAMNDDPRPLFVTFMGPLTDLASAYLLEPRIAGRLTAVWIGGGKYPAGGAEFNLGNDIHAANTVFSSGITLWQVPKNVYEMMAVSFAELECRVRPWGKIGAYLFDQLMAHAWEEGPRKSAFRTGETWVLGDNPVVGLLLYEHRFCFDYINAPFITRDMAYVSNGLSRPIRVYNSVDSRLILEDLFGKLKLFFEKNQEAKEKF
jgi:hypothetical protein